MSFSMFQMSRRRVAESSTGSEGSLCVCLPCCLDGHNGGCDCFASDDSSEAGGSILSSSSSSSSSDSDLTVASPPKKTKTGLAALPKIHDDLMLGARAVHENFLDQLIYNQVVGLLVGSAAMIIIGPYLVSSPGNNPLEQLVELVTKISDVINDSPDSLLLRYLGEATISEVFSIFTDILRMFRRTTTLNASERGAIVGLCTRLDNVVLGPFWEEVLFRGSLTLIWAILAKIGNQSKEAARGKEGWFPWRQLVLANSLWFGLLHFPKIASGFQKLSLDSETAKLDACALLLDAICTCVNACLCSAHFYVPAWEQHGLAASIGAHMVWNLNCLCLPFSISVRLLNRTAQCVYGYWCMAKNEEEGDSKVAKGNHLYVALKTHLWVQLASASGGKQQEELPLYSIQ